MAQYLDEIAQGAVDPRAEPIIEREEGERVVLDGQRAFGQVGGAAMAELAVERSARSAVAMVSVFRVSHTGRIGAFVEAVAEHDRVGVLFASGTGLPGRWVAPAGGRSGRLSTNPLAYAFPSSEGPVVADFATSTAPEGVIRSLRQRGLKAAPDTLIDGAGQPTTDPAVLYAEPAGAILPLGGASFGHKGSALALLVEVLASILPGGEYDSATRPANTMTLLALRVDEGFAGRMHRLGAFVRSAPPLRIDRPVLLPGDIERATLLQSANVLVDSTIWDVLRRAGDRARVMVPEPR